MFVNHAMLSTYVLILYTVMCVFLNGLKWWPGGMAQDTVVWMLE